MWIFKNDAFVSIVQDWDMPDQLWARARIRGDLERFFDVTDLPVIETPSADYRFRVVVDREAVKSALICAVDDIDYDNFKSSIAATPVEDERHNAYLKVWSAMMAFQRWVLQREETARRNKRGKKKENVK